MIKESHSHPAVHRMIEGQLRSWEMHKSRHDGGLAEAPSKIHPFISISRRIGAGATEIARRVGQRLDRPVFDKELLNHIVDSPEARQRMADLLDERDVGWFEEMLWPLIQGKRSSGRHSYFRELCEVIFSVARQGPTIFLGRGAGIILPHTVGLCVGVTASPENCTKRFAQRNHLDLRAAQLRIAELERERASFLESHFTKSQLSESRYDLIVNTDRLGIEAAADVIANAAAVVEARRNNPAQPV